MIVPVDYPDIVGFWRAAGPTQWFAKDDAFDAECTARFEAPWAQAAAGGLSAWESAADPALALVLLLDQMPRNMFRGTARMYASDPQARAAADRAVAMGFDRRVDAELRPFFYLPFGHSERREDQDRSVALFQSSGDERTLQFARRHRGIVARFGRFPHRNALLGRRSTPEEEAWLALENSFKG